MKTILFWFFFIITAVFVINSILSLNKTIYILFGTLFIFILSFMYLIYLGFEFLALSFFITYLGGIFIIFLFLIIVLDVSEENLKPVVIPSNKFLSTIVISVLVAFFSYEFFNAYTTEYVGTMGFKQLIDLDNLFWYPFFSSLVYFVLNDYSVITNYHMYRVVEWVNESSVWFEWNSLYVYFSDSFIIGLFLFYNNYIGLVFISIFLLFATILSCFICLKKN